MKRILAISLSVLIVLGIFVNNVHAAVSFVDDILPSDFPKSESSLVWVNANGVKLYKGYTGMGYEFYFTKSSTTLFGSTDTSSLSITKVSDNTYTASDTLKMQGNSLSYTFNLNNSGKAKSIIVEIEGSDYSEFEGIYTAQRKISAILPSNFPTTKQDAWKNGVQSLYLMDGNFVNNDDFPLVSLDDIVSINKDGNYYVISSDNGGTYTFVMEGDVFTSIIISGLNNTIFSGVNGTYTVFIPPKTISNILDTVDGGFPLSNDNKAPANAWVSSNGIKAYYSNSKTELIITELPSPISSDTVLTEGEGGNYTATILNGIVINFLMNNDKLIEIEIIIDDDTISFSPLGNRKTLDMLFAGVAGDDYPDSEQTAWINENGKKIYFDSGLLKFADLSVSEEEMLHVDEIVLEPEGTTYKGKTYITLFTANMENGVIKSLNIYFDYPGESLISEEYNGTYKVPLRIKDILNTVPDGFPTANASEETPTNAWVSPMMTVSGAYYSNNKKIFNLAGMQINSLTAVSINSNGNYFAALSSSNNVIFIMNDNILERIDLINPIASISFKPLGNRKTISYILENFASYFPKNEEQGWKNINNADVKIYCDENDEEISFTGSVGIVLPLYVLLEPNDTGYTLDYNGIVVNFEIENSNLICIDFISGSSKAIGKYYRYNIKEDETNEIIIDISHNDDIVFTSEAPFGNFIDVKVDGILLTKNKDYTVTQGSTIVALCSSYLKTLSKGSHTIEIMSSDGSAFACFKITDNSKKPSSNNSKHEVLNTGVDIL